MLDMGECISMCLPLCIIVDELMQASLDSGSKWHGHFPHSLLDFFSEQVPLMLAPGSVVTRTRVLTGAEADKTAWL